MGPLPSAPALDSCNIDAIEDCPAPSPDVQEEGAHRSLHRGGHLERPLSSHQPAHALQFVSISQVPQGYERGAGERAWRACSLWETWEEHSSVLASRSPRNSLKLSAQRRAG